MRVSYGTSRSGRLEPTGSREVVSAFHPAGSDSIILVLDTQIDAADGEKKEAPARFSEAHSGSKVGRGDVGVLRFAQVRRSE